jgi:hypothetical protein
VRDPPGKVAEERIKVAQGPAHHDDATQRWRRDLETTAADGEWPAPGGSVADIRHPMSPTAVLDFQWEHVTQTGACVVRMVGINNGGTVVVKAMASNGVLSDTGANSCMADSEEHLVQCHDIAPVAVGLALKCGEEPMMPV